ncbi:MAG: type II toxin-antitoxin system HicB family antitoxin [Spirochaetota bacterium]|nr:type II toxin-antitoxin system HicB family antitoxin [Spirochaetota bacterium]
MLIKYIKLAMGQATYRRMEDETFVGEIPDCPGISVKSADLSTCQDELQDNLEKWIILKISKKEPLPVINSINLNIYI